MKIYQVEYSDYDEHDNYGCFFSEEQAEKHMANLEAEGHGGGPGTMEVFEYDVLALAPEWYTWYSIHARWTEGEIEVWSRPNRSYGPFTGVSEPYVNAQPRHYHHDTFRPAHVSVSLQTLDEETGKVLALRAAEAEVAKIKGEK